MKQHLEQKLSQTLAVSDNEMEFILAFFNGKNLKKGDFFLKKDEICNDIAFVNNGLLRIFTVDNKQEKILSFPKTGQIVTSINSFLSETPSPYSIQAIIDTDLFVIKKSDVEFIYETIPGAQRISFEFFDFISEIFHSRITQLLTMQPLEIYQMLIRKNPEVIKNVPIKDLASYMNITPQHLSRLRNKSFKTNVYKITPFV